MKRIVGSRTALISTIKIMGVMTLMIFSSAQAELGSINIRLMGMVVALGCTVDPGDVDKPVDLGQWSTNQLNKKGNTTSPKAFSLHLTGCSTSSVTLAFTGTKDKSDSTLLALSKNSANTASAVAIQIMDNHQTRIPLGDNAPPGLVDENGNVTLHFYASYVSTANNSVTAGEADADSTFTLTYD